jgi:hypothetical protein
VLTELRPTTCSHTRGRAARLSSERSAENAPLSRSVPSVTDETRNSLLPCTTERASSNRSSRCPHRTRSSSAASPSCPGVLPRHSVDAPPQPRCVVSHGLRFRNRLLAASRPPSMSRSRCTSQRSPRRVPSRLLRDESERAGDRAPRSRVGRLATPLPRSQRAAATACEQESAWASFSDPGRRSPRRVSGSPAALGTEPLDGRGWVRTSDLPRVRRTLSH